MGKEVDKMGLSDAEFDQHLDSIIQSTMRILQDQSPGEFATTVFIVTAEAMHVQALIQLDGEQADPYVMLTEFGKQVAVTTREPLAVFVCAEAKAEPDKECFLITGCTSEGKTNAAELVLQRDTEGRVSRIDQTATHYYRGAYEVSALRNPAVMVMDGILEKS